MRLFKSILLAGLIAGAFVALPGCANTIRGAGQDAANTVNAAQGAARRTVKAVGS